MAKNKGVETEEAEETTETQTPPAEPTAAEKAQAELQSRIEAQDRKIADLEAAKPAPTVATQPVLTAAQIRALGTDETQREQVEKATGMKFDAYVTAVEQNETVQREARLSGMEAKNNVRAAIEDACSAEPQLTKLRSGINEFMDEFVSVADKADPKKLAAAMKKAITYAKGKAHESGTVFTPTPKAGGKTVNKTDRAPEFEQEDEGGDGTGPLMESGEVKPGVHNLIGGGSVFKLNIEEKTPEKSGMSAKAFKEATRHPDDANGVRFGKDYDKAPKFG